jgi:hypothetical protein
VLRREDGTGYETAWKSQNATIIENLAYMVQSQEL